MRNALTNFKIELGRISDVSSWLSTQPALTVNMTDATYAIRCGAVVLLCGYFENFLKECLKEFIEDVNGLKKPLLKIPESMRHTHYRGGAKALERNLKFDKQNGNTYLCDDLSARLASFSDPNNYCLAWEAFANTKSNPGPDVVAEMLGSVGVDKPWEKIRVATPAGSINLKTFLTSFIAMRNECAHSGNIGTPPSAVELGEYVTNLATLGAAIVQVLQPRFGDIKNF